ncbi:relaxase domain-containing protein [Streptomyces abyssomicinicus]|uniref:relaxase domain-containing protein n=1 Tax=Streptomyces abyssomicinicus TaxID=574929 RepID=UPI0012502F0C|nr:relaxase domain-containing protein [Streptomyces abyssomicinicus]
MAAPLGSGVLPPLLATNATVLLGAGVLAWAGTAVAGYLGRLPGWLTRTAPGGPLHRQSADHILLSLATGTVVVTAVGQDAMGVDLLALGVLARCEDGKWRSNANSGKDLYRHASAADAFFKARVRALTAQRFGVRRTQAETTRAWEGDGIPEQLRDTFSRRSALVTEQVGEDASLEDKQRLAAVTCRAKHAADAAGMRESWRQRAENRQAEQIRQQNRAASSRYEPPAPSCGSGLSR